MPTGNLAAEEVHLRAENIGGIDETNVTFEQGVSVLSGRNATNRTSLLQAIMAGLGSPDVSLKGDADEGQITLKIGDEEYTRTLERQGGSVRLSGDPYLENAELADLFAFLLESNEARRTVAQDEDLREIIMRPVDADAIKAEIRQLTTERDNVDEQIESLQAQNQRLPKLQKRKQTLESDIEKKEIELDKKREELDSLSTDAKEARSGQTELDRKMQTLQEKRSDLDTSEFRIDSEEESLESLEAEREELDSRYEKLHDEDLNDLSHIESEITRLRESKQQLESELNKLQNVIQFNEEMLEGTNTDIAAALRDGNTNGSVTDQLVDDSSEVVCWTCGTEVDVDEIETTLERLRNLRRSKYAERSDVEDELSTLKSKKSDVESTKQKRADVKEQLAEVEAEIEQRETRLEELETEREDIESEIDDIRTEIEELEAEDRSEVLEVHREVNELELQIDRLNGDLEDVEAELDDIESQDEEIDSLEERREQINDQLDELRNRIDRIEQKAVDEFNDHMDTVLELLDYDNLDRIWVERVETETRQGRHRVTTSEFRLHIVRSTEDGVAYEDRLKHLSESEREVTGLIFALAGYLAHHVYEDVPFIILDSLEAIDSERIATLVDYVSEYADHLVVALLAEDAAALDDDYQRISEI
ncbi:chromosome segregation protein SMC [Halobacteriales archaeon QS_4_69_225]|nr:MAG: chromosome segregation protein SMC [Halobacteriales archaeon QS_4_69_225]